MKLPKDYNTDVDSGGLDDTSAQNSERMKDHHLFQVLQMLLKLSANCPSFLTSEKYEEAVSTLAGKPLRIHYFSIYKKKFYNNAAN